MADLKFSSYFDQISALNAPEEWRANLEAALAEIESASSVPEGLEDAIPATYTIQPLKALNTGDLIIYVGKGETVSFGDRLLFFPLKVTKYRIIFDLEDNRVKRRIFNWDVKVELSETEALYIVQAVFGITEDLRHFFVVEGLRSKIDTVKAFVDALLQAARQKRLKAVYEVMGEAKVVEKNANKKRFKTIELAVAGESPKEYLPLLAVAKNFVEDYIRYRAERVRVPAEEEPSVPEPEPVKTEGLEDIEKEIGKF